MLPLVSIIITCFNDEEFIEEAILSALNQTYKNTEVIIIDDASTDNSSSIINSFSDRVHIEHWSVNQGVQLARNTGIKLAKGSYIKFLDSDDILFLDCIEKQVSQSLSFPPDSKFVIYGDVVWVDRDLIPVSGYPAKPQRSDQSQLEFILASSPLTSSPLHKREYLLDVGGFDPYLINRHENDLHLRLVLEGVSFFYEPCLIYQYRQSDSPKRLSQAAYSKNGSMYYFEVLQREKALIESKLEKELSPKILEVLARDFWSCGRVILREGYSNDAREYFSEAQKLHSQNCIVGNFPYPLFVKILGPFWAEHLMSLLRKLIS